MALNNLQWLMSYKTKPNQYKPNQTKPTSTSLVVQQFISLTELLGTYVSNHLESLHIYIYIYIYTVLSILTYENVSIYTPKTLCVYSKTNVLYKYFVWLGLGCVEIAPQTKERDVEP